MDDLLAGQRQTIEKLTKVEQTAPEDEELQEGYLDLVDDYQTAIQLRSQWLQSWPKQREFMAAEWTKVDEEITPK